MTIRDNLMTLNHYQALAKETAIYPYKGTINGLLYTTLGLVGEAGEIANKTKKILRDHGGVLTAEMRDDLVDELGDCLWYVATLADELNRGLATVALQNIQKLDARAENGTLKGSGDNR